MNTLNDIYSLLYSKYGAQGWWPLCVKGEMKYFVTDKPNTSQQFEIAVGAILAQNTNWTNAGKAVLSLNAHKLLSPSKIISCQNLPKVILSSGYHNQKAKTLKTFSSYLLNHNDLFSGSNLRENLLSIKGIGPETADSILLYSVCSWAGIGDNYTRRIFSRYGFENVGTYNGARNLLENEFAGDIKEMKEFHALLVEHAKVSCTKNSPSCSDCILSRNCIRLLS